MGVNFTVDPEEVRAAANRQAQAAERAATLATAATHLRALADALPGGDTAAAAPVIASAVEGAAKSIAGRINFFSMATNTAASRYAATDQGAVSLLVIP